MKQKKDAMIRARTNGTLKRSAEEILSKLGMTPSEAINLFYAKIVLTRSIPFAITLEEDDTEDQYITIEDSDHLAGLLKI